MAKGLNVVVAALSGFVAGVLMTPKSGKETREDLKNKASEAKQMAGERAGQVKGAVKDGYETVRSGAKDVAEEVKGFGRSAKGSADELAEEARTRSARVNAKTEATKRGAKSDVESHLR